MYDPQYLYHPTLAPTGKMVKSDQEEAALGEGWVDTPAKFPVPEPVVDMPHPPTEEEAADIGRPADAEPVLTGTLSTDNTSVLTGSTVVQPPPITPRLPGRNRR